MIITKATPYLTMDRNNNALFLVIETDAGFKGYGEGTNHFVPQGAWGMLKDLCPYLVGQDPERIEYVWQMCHRRLFYRGGPGTGAALAAIDMALWDIKGKAHGMPVYQLLGGLARDKVRLYGHVGGQTAAEAAEQARQRADQGITAIRFRAFHSYDAIGLHDHKLAVDQQVEYLAAIRDAVGDDVDLIVEAHGRYDPEWAVRLAKAIAPYRPFLLEDPIRHENPHALAQLRAHTDLPLATGERYHDKWDFLELINNRYVDYLRPDVCHCGGITEMRKIAAMGEAQMLNLIPHNNAGPLGTAASLHASLAINNVVLMEAPFVNGSRDTDVVGPFPQVVDGYALPLQEPGLGVEFVEEMAASREFVPRMQPELRALDGSVRDF